MSRSKRKQKIHSLVSVQCWCLAISQEARPQSVQSQTSVTNVPTPPSPFIVMWWGTSLWPVWVSCVPSQAPGEGDVAEAALVLCQSRSAPLGWQQHLPRHQHSPARGAGENQLQLLQSQAGASVWVLRGVLNTAGRMWLCVHPWCLNSLPCRSHVAQWLQERAPPSALSAPLRLRSAEHHGRAPVHLGNQGGEGLCAQSLHVSHS